MNTPSPDQFDRPPDCPPDCPHDIPNATHVSFAKWICPICNEDISLAFTLYCESLRDE